MPEPLQVELEHENKPEVKVEVKAEEKKEPQYVSVDELKKITQQLNGISSTLRTTEKERKELKSQLAELEGRLSGKAIKPSEAQDELDKLLEQGEWRTPVKKVAESTVEEILNRRDAQRVAQEHESEKLRVLEESKKSVRSRYPDIDDPNSETAKTYMKILNEKPHYLRSEYGPVLAMRDMEDILETKEDVNQSQEAARRARVSAASVRPGTPAKSEVKTLTREQKEFCKNSGLKEETYLRTLNGMSTREKELE